MSATPIPKPWREQFREGLAEGLARAEEEIERGTRLPEEPIHIPIRFDPWPEGASSAAVIRLARRVNSEPIGGDAPAGSVLVWTIEERADPVFGPSPCDGYVRISGSINRRAEIVLSVAPHSWNEAIDFDGQLSVLTFDGKKPYEAIDIAAVLDSITPSGSSPCP